MERRLLKGLVIIVETIDFDRFHAEIKWLAMKMSESRWNHCRRERYSGEIGRCGNDFGESRENHCHEGRKSR